MKIYTRTGDTGTTGLVGGDRLGKNDPRMHAIGEVDELNATLGLARTFANAHPLDSELAWIQNLLFDLGAELASPSPEWKIESLRDDHIQRLEDSVDQQTELLPPLKQFILPGGDPLAAHLHLARTVARRVERSVLSLHSREAIRPVVLKFLNRLADWLFVAARTANHSRNVSDVVWEKST
jgi:cob(I)alamin adenosyltransferase